MSQQATTVSLSGEGATTAKTPEQAVSNARSYFTDIARSIVSESYPEIAEEESAAEEAKAKPAPEAEQPEESEAGVQEEQAETASEEAEASAAETEVEGEQEQDQQAENTEPEGDGEAELPENVQASINKRIGKEVAKTKAEREAKEALKAELDALKAEVEQLKTTKPDVPRPVPTGDNPLASVDDVKALEVEKQKAQKLADDANDLLERLDDDPREVAEVLRSAKIDIKDDEGEFSVKGMKRFLRNVRKTAMTTLNQHVPERVSYLQEQAAAKARVFELVPELANKSSQQAKLFDQIVAQFPMMKADPRWPVFAMVQMAGLQALQKQQPAKAQAKPAPAKIPAKPKAAVAASPKAKGVPEGGVKQMLLSGDKEARLSYLQKLVE